MNTFKTVIAAALVFLLFPSRGKSQQVDIYTDSRNNKYAAINMRDMPRNIEDRNKNSSFYTEVQLYDSSENPVTDDSGADVYVKRITRHENQLANSLDLVVSSYFIVSPNRVISDGTSPDQIMTSDRMTWAVANGYLSSANSLTFTPSPPVSSAAQTGCSAYRGADGKDDVGTWRVPTRREGVCMLAFRKELEATKDDTRFVSFNITANADNIYWLATEFYYSKDAWYMCFNRETDYRLDKASKTSAFYLRCVRDISE